MPRRNADARSRILERFVLQPRRVEAERPAQLQQALFVGADEVCHRLIMDGVVMKPNAAVEGEAQPLAAAFELLKGRGGRYVQVILPAWVALPTAAALPLKR